MDQSKSYLKSRDLTENSKKIIGFEIDRLEISVYAWDSPEVITNDINQNFVVNCNFQGLNIT